MSEGKPHLSIVICGHVDSGKSTTTGRLIFELGGIPERELEKLKEEAAALGKSSFAFAFYMDRQKEERERGVTISCTTKEFFTNNWHYTIIDAPGEHAGAARARLLNHRPQSGRRCALALLQPGPARPSSRGAPRAMYAPFAMRRPRPARRAAPSVQEPALRIVDCACSSAARQPGSPPPSLAALGSAIK
jgi:hypothetical protein